MASRVPPAPGTPRKKISFIEAASPQSSEPSFKPAADAGGVQTVTTPEPGPATPLSAMLENKAMPSTPRWPAIFDGYDEKAEDACRLLPEGAGHVLALMGAKQTQKMAAYLIGKATDSITLTAYTFDLMILADELAAAQGRGIDVTVIVDRNHMLTGATNYMVERLSGLKSAGVPVWLSRGISGSTGIQHSKTLRADDLLIMGSTNWTNASRLNQEMSVLIKLNEDGLTAYEERVKTYLGLSCPFSDALEESGVKNRNARGIRGGGSRSTSVSTMERYATAKRFSIARARSASRGPHNE